MNEDPILNKIFDFCLCETEGFTKKNVLEKNLNNKIYKFLRKVSYLFLFKCSVSNYKIKCKTFVKYIKKD